MDPLMEEELVMEPDTSYNPFSLVVQFLGTYGWYAVGASVAAAYALHRLRPQLDKWRQAREDADYHKDPDKALARLEATQRARERQQELLLEASHRAAELQKEREEKKRQEQLERLKKYGAATNGHRLGSNDEYLPLSGGAAGGSTYRAPKKSKCGGGGCGK